MRLIAPDPVNGLSALIRLRLDVGYDGTDFHGWASQPGVRTVQGVLESGLSLALRSPQAPTLTVAGRTDAGVHARGQVAHLDLPSQSWAAVATTAPRRIDRILPADIKVYSVTVAPEGFDARFSALWRRYSYRVSDRQASADPLRRRDTLWWPRALDLDRMNDAAASCLGEHDFAAFCRSRPGATTIRELLALDWRRDDDSVAVATVKADAFCHNMVRALVGALLAIGDGRRPASWLAEVLTARIRDPAVIVAPPHPLCLEQVGYPPDAELAARAGLTRRIRNAS